MDADERRQKILELIHQNGKVKVNELSEIFKISEVTIRMDLADLEKKGLLTRVHGGAVSSYKTYYNMSLQQRMKENQEEKQKIAEKIVSMIDDNDTIMLNSGTTTLMVLRMIPANMALNVVTNSIVIATEAGSKPNLNVILLGGSVNYKYQFTYGDDAITQLKRYHADKLILSVDGVNSERGLTTYYDKEAELARTMFAQSNLSIIAADYTKIGRIAFAEISPITEADYIITNSNAPKDEIKSLEKFCKDIVLL
jgi:DeoR/GlpR family transcriptional regulator of sugar metabolism